MLATFEENKSPFFSLASEECCVVLRGSAEVIVSLQFWPLVVTGHGRHRE